MHRGMHFQAKTSKDPHPLRLLSGWLHRGILNYGKRRDLGRSLSTNAVETQVSEPGGHDEHSPGLHPNNLVKASMHGCQSRDLIVIGDFDIQKKKKLSE